MFANAVILPGEVNILFQRGRNSQNNTYILTTFVEE